MREDAGIVTAIRRSLISNGFQPVAVKTGEKAPLGMAWQMKRGLPPLSDAALNTGILCEGLSPADIDVDDADAVEAIVKIFDEVAGHSSLRRTRPNSSHCLLFYRAPDGTRPKKRVIKLGDLGKVEFLGLGQQFVAYGMHPSGVEFEWPEAGPDIVKREDTLVLTPEHEAEIERRLRATFDLPVGDHAASPSAPVATSRALDASLPHRPDTGARERAAFEAALADEVRKVTQAGEGQRNHTLNVAAFSLAQMVASGWGGQSEVDTALTEAALACGLRQPEIRKTIASGFASGTKKPRPALENRDGYGESLPEIDIRLTRVNGVTIVADTGEVVDDADDDLEEDADEAPPAPVDNSLTHIGGLLGELVDWIADCGSSGNRVLAMSAALPFMGTLLGRRMATPTQHGGNLELYVISLFPSGEGKSDAARCVHRLFDALGLANQHKASASTFGSGAALSNHICRQPLSLMIVDEISDWFGTFLGQTTPHLATIEGELKKAWGVNFSSYATGETRDKAANTVNCPTFSIYGMTTPDALFRVIKSREVENGFVNRLTVIDAGEYNELRREPKRSYRDVPEKLLSGLRDMYAMGASGRGNLSTFVDKNAAVDPSPVITPWGPDGADEIFYAFNEEMRERRKQLGAPLDRIYIRTAFMAVKMATIRALGDRSPVMADHMRWGMEIARRSADHFHAELASKMRDPLSAGELIQKIMEQFTKPTPQGEKEMEKYGDSTLRRRFLFLRLQHHLNRNAGELDNALKTMENNGIIHIGKKTVRGAKDVPVVTYLIKRRKRAA